MKKFFLQSFAGSLSTLTGVASGYIYIDGLRIKANHMMLGLALVLLTVGIFFLRKAIKSGNPFSERLESLPGEILPAPEISDSTNQQVNNAQDKP